MFGSRARGTTVVLRRESEHAICLTAFLGVVGILSFLTFEPPRSSSLSSRFEFLIIAGFFAWIPLLISKARIDIYDEGICVVNWFARWNIPWQNLADVQIGQGVRLILVDGRTIQAAIGGRSLASDMRGNITQKRIGDRINSRRPSSPGDRVGTVKPKIDIHLWEFLVFLAVFAGLTVLIYHVRH